MKPIFLIGLPGAGKTTLGRPLARKAGLDFIDLDQYIQGRFFCSVADIFARWGEERFRQIEANLLREIGEMEDVVIACGGGTPCFHDNMDYMLSRGTTLYLVPSRERLAERLRRGRKRRPAIADKTDEQIDAYIDATLAARDPVYSRAHHRLVSTELESRASIAAAVDEAIRKLKIINDK